MPNRELGLTVLEASKLLGKSEQFIRKGLQDQRLPFGWAVETSEGRWSYFISKKLVSEFIGDGKEK